MAVKAGTTGVVKLSTSDGSEAAVAHIRSFSFDETADTIETTAMHASAVHRTYVAGPSNSTLSLEVYWDTADAPQLEVDVRATLFWEVYPHGTGTGEKYYHGSGIVTGKTIAASFDGMTEASFSIQNISAITEATA